MRLPLAVAILVYGLLFIVFRVLAAKKIKDDARVEGETQWLEPNLFAAWSLFFLGLLVFKIADHLLPFLPSLLATLIATAAFILIASRYNYRIGIRKEGMIYRRWKEQIIPWDEIESVTFSYPRKGWIVATRNHGTLLVPTTLSGLPALFEAFQKRGIPYQ